jgi:hypothetical protein
MYVCISTLHLLQTTAVIWDTMPRSLVDIDTYRRFGGVFQNCPQDSRITPTGKNLAEFRKWDLVPPKPWYVKRTWRHIPYDHSRFCLIFTKTYPNDTDFLSNKQKINMLQSESSSWSFCVQPQGVLSRFCTQTLRRLYGKCKFALTEVVEEGGTLSFVSFSRDAAKNNYSHYLLPVSSCCSFSAYAPPPTNNPSISDILITPSTAHQTSIRIRWANV